MIQLSEIRLREIRLPLREPFRISSGVVKDRRILLLELTDASGARTWSECVAGEAPNYSPETIDTAWIAISQYVRARPVDWGLAGKWARRVLELLLARPPEPGRFWNVNLPQPPEPHGDVPECVFCDIDPHPLPVAYELRDGRLHYRGRYQDRARAAGYDVALCFSGRITISQVGLHSIPPSIAVDDPTPA